MTTKFAKYDHVAKAFQKYFSEDDLSLSLERKPDLYMLAEMNSKKAGKEEVARMEELINSLNHRVKHLSVV